MNFNKFYILKYILEVLIISTNTLFLSLFLTKDNTCWRNLVELNDYS